MTIPAALLKWSCHQKMTSTSHPLASRLASVTCWTMRMWKEPISRISKARAYESKSLHLGSPIMCPVGTQPAYCEEPKPLERSWCRHLLTISQQQPASLLAKLMSHLGSPAPMDLQMQVVSVNIWLRPPHPPNRMAPLSPVNPQTMMDNNTLLFKLWGSLLYGSKALSPRVVVKSKWGNAC